ncbi:MAG: EAL domain-containing protein (putative c-di-GMP-specific phosphodiesterase class I) [Gammaproteobacteria bacterium]|jgi:EAL domain-containing protein (putative c-di-GMP-specific phosphodiesterase class I)/GGDEF domain-containing protein
MSLYKQLWMAIAFIVAASFLGSFVVSSLSAKNYLEEQLFIKNSDNAGALALSLSQAGPDLVMLELTLSAQFDTGHYEFIRLFDPEGKVLIERVDDHALVEAPLWFARLFPIDAKAGSALVQSGWQQLGTLSIKSHSRYAYHELWRSSQQLLGYFLAQAMALGLLGSLALRMITRPLDNVVKQAQAIGDRRFITTKEPATREFKAVVISMNTLSTRIKDMLQQEANRLELLRKEIQIDLVTGLLNRKPLLNFLSTTLERNDARANGTMTIFRIPHLQTLNKSVGRVTIDMFLVRVGNVLNEAANKNTHWAAGRLNGSDFALISPEDDNPEKLGHNTQQSLLNLCIELNLNSQITIPTATTQYSAGESTSTLLGRLDNALASAQLQSGSHLEVAVSELRITVSDEETTIDWDKALENAFENQQFSLGSYPVTSLTGELLHDECPARMQVGQQILSAAQFLPWINRFDQSLALDREVIMLALSKLAKNASRICINLSPQAIASDQFIDWIINTLKQHEDKTSWLWIEIPEYGAYQHLEGFRKLCHQLKALNCRIGIKHLGYEVSQIGKLHDLGLDYVKIDASLVRDINDNAANKTLLRALCMIVHSIGLIAIAEGVQNEAQWEALEPLGLDGATGPMVTQYQQ